MVNNKRNQYKSWRLHVAFMLAEVDPTPSNIKLAWNAAKCVDLVLIKLTGGVPR